MLKCVHGQTSHGRADIQPTASSSLSQLSELVVDVARDPDRRACILADLPDLSALQPHVDELSRHDLCTVLTSLFLLGHNGCIGAGAATEYSASVGPRADIVHLGPNRNHVDRQAVPPPARFCCQDTRIDDTTHAVKKIFRNTSPVALHNISSAHAIGGNDIALPACCLFGQERNVSASPGIVLDALDKMWTGLPSLEVHCSNSSLCTAATVSDGDDTAVVPAALAMALLGEGQGKKRSPLPQMVVYGALEMSNTRGPRLVRPHQDGALSGLLRRRRGRGRGIGRGVVRATRGSGGVSPRNSGNKRPLAESGGPRNQGPEVLWLQHG